MQWAMNEGFVFLDGGEDNGPTLVDETYRDHEGLLPQRQLEQATFKQ